MGTGRLNPAWSQCWKKNKKETLRLFTPHTACLTREPQTSQLVRVVHTSGTAVMMGFFFLLAYVKVISITTQMVALTTTLAFPRRPTSLPDAQRHPGVTSLIKVPAGDKSPGPDWTALLSTFLSAWFCFHTESGRTGGFILAQNAAPFANSLPSPPLPPHSPTGQRNVSKPFSFSTLPCGNRPSSRVLAGSVT